MAVIVEAQPQIAFRRFRWSTAAFDRLVTEGYIPEGGRIFLWDGEIIAPMAEDPFHGDACENLMDLLKRRLAAEAWTINSGRPLALSDGFLPQPDLVVLPRPRSAYRGRRPMAEVASLVVEVANSSSTIDSGPYLRRYALEGISLYWIVNIKARRVEVYSQPDRQAGLFDMQANYGMGEAVPLVLGDVAFEPIPVEAILRDSIEG